YNITHLTLGDKIPTDYNEIKETFSSWIRENILVFEELGFYLYKQEFQWKGRSESTYGLIGLLELQPLGENVLPHEYTFSGPKADRLELLRNLRANLEPIWGIYEDKDSTLTSLWKDVEGDTPVVRVNSWDSRTHTVWKISENKIIERIQKFFTNKKILVADGHHRYEASWFYYNEIATESAKYILIMLTDLYDPGVKLLPTHRILKKDIEINIDDLRKYFEIYLEKDLYESIDLVFRPNDPYIYYVVDNKIFRLIPKEAYLKANDQKSELWWILPTSLLHKGIWEGILGKLENELQEKGYIRFSHDIREVKTLLNEGNYRSAFVLPSIPIEVVYTLAINKERLPQKSTYFYPKPISGLLLWKMDE
ncbi:MAG: DUF1015 family protein, partial [Dictyoglomus sp.]